MTSPTPPTPISEPTSAPATSTEGVPSESGSPASAAPAVSNDRWINSAPPFITPSHARAIAALGIVGEGLLGDRAEPPGQHTDAAVETQPDGVHAHQRGRLSAVGGGQRLGQRAVDATGLGQPIGRPRSQLPKPVRIAVAQSGAQQIAEQLVIAVPDTLGVEETRNMLPEWVIASSIAAESVRPSNASSSSAQKRSRTADSVRNVTVSGSS